MHFTLQKYTANTQIYCGWLCFSTVFTQCTREHCSLCTISQQEYQYFCRIRNSVGRLRAIFQPQTFLELFLNNACSKKSFQLHVVRKKSYLKCAYFTCITYILTWLSHPAILPPPTDGIFDT